MNHLNYLLSTIFIFNYNYSDLLFLINYKIQDFENTYFFYLRIYLFNKMILLMNVYNKLGIILFHQKLISQKITNNIIIHILIILKIKLYEID